MSGDPPIPESPAKNTEDEITIEIDLSDLAGQMEPAAIAREATRPLDSLELEILEIRLAEERRIAANRASKAKDCSAVHRVATGKTKQC